MPTLNADIPSFDCLLREEYLYDMDPDHAGKFVDVTVFGLNSIEGRALGFHVLVHEDGAVVSRLPICALMSKVDAPPLALDQLELWDCFSYEVSVWEAGHLSGRLCCVVLKDGSKHQGRYLFTVDWHGSSYSESAGHSGWKCAHIIALENGCYAAQPNNRIPWADPATSTSPFEKVPDYHIMSRTWACEGASRWGTSDRMFYDVRANGHAVEV